MRATGFVSALLLSFAVVGCNKPADAPMPVADSTTSVEGAGDPVAAPAEGGAQAEIAPAAPAAPAAAPVPVTDGVASLTPENTTIQFVGTHTGERPDPRTGVFQEFKGQAMVDPESKTLKAVTIEINSNSLETPIPNLTTHLRSNDFLDAREYPSIQFESTSISAVENGAATITGKLTLMKETKEINFPAQVTLTDDGLQINAEFQIDRTEYGMTGVQDRVNKEVTIAAKVGQKTQLPQASPMGGGPGRGGPRGPSGPGGFDPVAMFKQRDANGDGKLSGDEISDRMRQNLEQTDKDGDGAVTLEEFQERLAQFRQGPSGPGGPGAPSAPAAPAAPEAPEPKEEK